MTPLLIINVISIFYFIFLSYSFLLFIYLIKWNTSFYYCRLLIFKSYSLKKLSYFQVLLDIIIIDKPLIHLRFIINLNNMDSLIKIFYSWFLKILDAVKKIRSMDLYLLLIMIIPILIKMFKLIMIILTLISQELLIF